MIKNHQMNSFSSGHLETFLFKKQDPAGHLENFPLVFDWEWEQSVHSRFGRPKLNGEWKTTWFLNLPNPLYNKGLWIAHLLHRTASELRRGGWMWRGADAHSSLWRIIQCKTDCNLSDWETTLLLLVLFCLSSSNSAMIPSFSQGLTRASRSLPRLLLSNLSLARSALALQNGGE